MKPALARRQRQVAAATAPRMTRGDCVPPDDVTSFARMDTESSVLVDPAWVTLERLGGPSSRDGGTRDDNNGARMTIRWITRKIVP